MEQKSMIKNTFKRLGMIFIYIPFAVIVFIFCTVVIAIPYWIVTGKDFLDNQVLDFLNNCYEPFERD